MGNRDFLMHLRAESTRVDTATLIARALEPSEASDTGDPGIAGTDEDSP